jgi:hypothetical protein
MLEKQLLAKIPCSLHALMGLALIWSALASGADKDNENDSTATDQPAAKTSAISPTADSITSPPSVIKSPSSIGEVSFQHEYHFTELELECKTCHHEAMAATLKFPHEDYFKDFWIDCKICHHEARKTALPAQACSNCHHTVPTTIADETLSAKVVIHKDCWKCHETGTGAEASQECKFCHQGPRSGS